MRVSRDEGQDTDDEALNDEGKRMAEAGEELHDAGELRFGAASREWKEQEKWGQFHNCPHNFGIRREPARPAAAPRAPLPR
jgi:hypothetical protein